MQEHQAGTSGRSEATPSFIQLPAASGRSSLEESGSSTMFDGSSAASCSTFPDSQASIRSSSGAPAISSFTNASTSQAAIHSGPHASASSSYTAESSSQADIRSMPDASTSSRYPAEPNSAAGATGIASRVGSSISTAGKAPLGTAPGHGIPDASTHGMQRQSPGTWQASDVPELLFSFAERTPVVGLLTAVPIAAARSGGHTDTALSVLAAFTPVHQIQLLCSHTAAEQSLSGLLQPCLDDT